MELTPGTRLGPYEIVSPIARAAWAKSLRPARRIALEVRDPTGTDIWTYDWQRDTMTRLTFTGKTGNPVWTPDGRYIAFGTAGGGISASFTPDGKRMAFRALNSTGGWLLLTVPIESDGAGLRAGKPEVFLQTPAVNAHHPTFSPDGRWPAYASYESGANQIYVRAFPDNGGKWQISNGDSGYPMWSRTGHELYFETPDGGSNGIKNLDLAPDGKRMAVLMPAEAKETKGRRTTSSSSKTSWMNCAAKCPR